MATTGASVGWVVDCGSGHTSIYKYSLVEGGEIDEVYKHKMMSPEGLDVQIGKTLIEGTSDVFIGAIIADLGEEAEKNPLVIVGATGGVRKLLDSKEISQSQVDDFSVKLRSVFGARASFTVLTGDEEASLETNAVKSIFGPYFTKHGKDRSVLGLLSGGGMSIQVAQCNGDKCSLRLDTFVAGKILGEKGDEALASIEETFKSTLKEAKPDLTQVRGIFVGTAMQQSVAKSGGFDERFVGIAEAREKLDTLIDGLIAQSGPAWDFFLEANKTKGDPIRRRGIIIVSALRLRVMLKEVFADDAEFFFSRTPPGVQINCEWTVGKFVEQVSDNAADATPTTGGLFDFILVPNPQINYNFVCTLYGAGAVMCGGLYAAEKFLVGNSVDGFWIVMSPFVPGLLWGLYLRNIWLKTLPPSDKKKSD